MPASHILLDITWSWMVIKALIWFLKFAEFLTPNTVMLVLWGIYLSPNFFPADYLNGLKC